MKGSVVWFNNLKGFGFLRPEDGGRDVFVHYSAIESTGYRTLKQNENVEFLIEEGSRGPQATKVFAFSEVLKAEESDDGFDSAR